MDPEKRLPAAPAATTPHQLASRNHGLPLSREDRRKAQWYKSIIVIMGVERPHLCRCTPQRIDIGLCCVAASTFVKIITSNS
jgi:hypothetical protein